MTEPISIYIHWPFCRSKCSYCNFMSVPFEEALCTLVYNKIIRDIIEYKKCFLNKEVVSVFFGGGTPSLLSCTQLNSILNQIFSLFKINNQVEITLEVNPETVDIRTLAEFKNAGINRISLGCQSFYDDDLHFLGCHCSAENTFKCLENVSNIFDNYSCDFIYGFEIQSNDKLIKNIDTAIKLGVKHLSLYRLSIERNTQLYQMYKSGKYKDISESREAGLYQLIQDETNARGMYQYEISNFALSPKYESKHNLAYWNYNDYFGFGPSAHSRISLNGYKYAVENKSSISSWLNSESSFVALTSLEEREEAILMGLRTIYGVDERYLKNINITYFLNNNLLKYNTNRFVIPFEKFVFSDYIIREIIASI